MWSQSAGVESMAWTMSGVKSLRMRGGEAHSADPGDLRHAAQQFRETQPRGEGSRYEFTVCPRS